jgi:predicted nucleotidyltransferase
VTLLQERDAKRAARRLTLRDEVRRELATALAELLPGSQVVVFGSLLRAGIFNAASDIDLALTADPRGQTVWRLQAELEERLGRPVDIVLLSETRLREKILREGETWTTEASSP